MLSVPIRSIDFSRTMSSIFPASPSTTFGSCDNVFTDSGRRYRLSSSIEKMVIPSSVSVLLNHQNSVWLCDTT